MIFSLVIRLALFVSVALLIEATQDDHRISSSVIQLTSNLFRTLREPKKNLIFSPISIQVALNLVLLGTEKGSLVEDEIVRVLGYDDWNESHEEFNKLVGKLENIGRDKNDAVVDLWTMMMTKSGIKPGKDYVHDIKTYYNSSIEDVLGNEKRVEVARSINKWGKESGFKYDLLTSKEMDSNFIFMLLSAIRLETKWIDAPFHETLKNSPFYNHGTQKVYKAKSLQHLGGQGKYVELTEYSKIEYKEHHDKLKAKHSYHLELLQPLNCRVISLKLEGELEYLMIEPFSNKSAALEELEDKLFSTERGGYKQSMMSALLSVLDDNEASIYLSQLRMPKFMFDSNIQLENHLKKIGLTRMFSGSNSLTRISNGLQVTAASHKAFVEVNKRGIKAAGFTSIDDLNSLLMPPEGSIPVVVERPFVFIIRHERIPLFAGRLDHL